MIKLSEKEYLIGVDNGYQYVKTRNFLFENGIREMSVEPSLKEHTMLINGKYYKVGEGRAGLLTKDEKIDKQFEKEMSVNRDNIVPYGDFAVVYICQMEIEYHKTLEN